MTPTRTLLDAAEKPLKRRSPTEPNLLEEWPVLFPQKPTSPRKLRIISDGELAILNQLQSRPKKKSSNEIRGSAEDDGYLSDCSSHGTVIHNLSLKTSDNSKDSSDSASGAATGDPSEDRSNSPLVEAHRVSSPSEAQVDDTKKESSLDTRAAAKNDIQIKHTKASALRAIYNAARTAENSPTAIPLIQDRGTHRPIRGNRIPSKFTPESRHPSYKAANKAELTKSPSCAISGKVATRTPSVTDPRPTSSRVVAEAKANSAPAKRLPSDRKPLPSNAKRLSSNAKLINSPFQPELVVSGDCTLALNEFAPHTFSNRKLVDAGALDVPLTASEHRFGEAGCGGEANGPLKVRPITRDRRTVTIKRLSQANPDYGPLLMISPFADNLIMGTDDANSRDANAVSGIFSDKSIVDTRGWEIYTSTANGPVMTTRNTSESKRDALKKRLQRVTSSAETRSSSKWESCRVESGSEHEANDRQNKFLRDPTKPQFDSRGPSESRLEVRRPLLEPLSTLTNIGKGVEDPFVEQKKNPEPNASTTETCNGAQQDFSDIAAPGKEAHWISPVLDQRSSLAQDINITTFTSPTDKPEEQKVVTNTPITPGMADETHEHSRSGTHHDDQHVSGDRRENGQADSDGPAHEGRCLEKASNTGHVEQPAAPIMPSKASDVAGSPSSYPARKSSKVAVTDYTAPPAVQNSPSAPLQHNPPHEYVERQNFLGATNGMQSIERGPGTEQATGASVSKRGSIADVSRKSQASTSRGMIQRVRGFIQRSNPVTNTFRRTHKKSPPIGNFANPTAASTANSKVRDSNRSNSSTESALKAKGKHHKTPSRPTILPGSNPFPDIGDVHPAHRPQPVYGPLAVPPPLTRKSRTSSAPADLRKASAVAFGRRSTANAAAAAAAAAARGSPSHSDASLAWPLQPGVDPLSPIGLATARLAEKQGRYVLRSMAEIEAELASCSKLAQELLAQARTPQVSTVERDHLTQLSNVIVEALGLSRQASFAAQDADRAAFEARAAYDACARNVTEVANVAREWRGHLPANRAKVGEGSADTV